MPKPIVSADSHVAEPPNCYVDHIDPKFRDRAPRIVHDERLGDIFDVEGSTMPLPMGLICAAGKAPEDIRARGVRFEEVHRGGWDPHARLADQQRDGIRAEVLYPSVGMEICNIPDHALKQACMEAYNRWLVECALPQDPRVKAMLYLPFNTPAAAEKMVERFVGQPGVAGFLVCSPCSIS